MADDPVSGPEAPLSQSSPPSSGQRAPQSAGPPSPEGTPGSPWNPHSLRRGLQIFVLLTAVGVLLLYVRGQIGGDLSALGRLSPGTVLLGCLQAVFDVVMGGLRIWVLVRAFGAGIGIGPAIVSNGGNIFLGGVTPSQTGGGLAQIYVLVRAGLGLQVAVVASLVSFLCTVLVLLSAGLMVVLLGPSFALPVGFRWFSGGTVVIFACILVLFLLALPHPDLYRGGLRRPLRKIPRWGNRLSTSSALQKLERTLADFAALTRQAIRQHKSLLLLGLLSSTLIYLNKFLVSYVVLRGLGLSVDLREVLYLQELQYLIVYFAPTPGASGLAEFSAGEIMAAVIPQQHFASFLILWRTFSLYLPMLLGAALLVPRCLSKRDGNTTRQASVRPHEQS